MSYDENNIFAKILRAEIPCDKIFENDYVLAFNDISKKKKVHVLVIPKKPYVDFKDFTDKASEAEIAAYFKAISEVIIKLGINETGYRLIANSGANGGQEVPHFHMHILAGEHVGPMVAK